MQWKERRNETNTIFPFFYCVETYEPLLIYTHYIITIFSVFLFLFLRFYFSVQCCLVAAARWLLLTTELNYAFMPPSRTFFILAWRRCGPFYLSFSFILFYSPLFRVSYLLKTLKRTQRCPRPAQTKKRRKNVEE